MRRPESEASPLVAHVQPGAFPVIHVPESAAESREKGGTTIKFWLKDKQLLFKEARPGTGEHWSEKIASELAAELGLSTPYVELAQWKDKWGVVTCSFLQDDEKYLEARKLLEALSLDFPKDERQHACCHTLINIFRSLKRVRPPLRWTQPENITGSEEIFVGYLLFDAWIANEDRHDENWGVIQNKRRKKDAAIYHLAPTFDHASSLGRELSDEKRKEILSSRTVDDYVARCKSGIFVNGNFEHPMTNLEVIERTATMHAGAVSIWSERLFGISKERMLALFDRIPSEAITPASRDFALAVLTANIERLKRTYKQLA